MDNLLSSASQTATKASGLTEVQYPIVSLGQNKADKLSIKGTSSRLTSNFLRALSRRSKLLSTWSFEPRTSSSECACRHGSFPSHEMAIREYRRDSRSEETELGIPRSTETAV